MLNCFRGSALVEGSSNVIDKLDEALSLLKNHQLCDVTGYSCDWNWLPQIFKGGESNDQCVTYVGHCAGNDNVEIFFEGYAKDWFKFFEFMSISLGVDITVECQNKSMQGIKSVLFISDTFEQKVGLWTKKEVQKLLKGKRNHGKSLQRNSYSSW